MTHVNINSASYFKWLTLVKWSFEQMLSKYVFIGEKGFIHVSIDCSTVPQNNWTSLRGHALGKIFVLGATDDVRHHNKSIEHFKTTLYNWIRGGKLTLQRSESLYRIYKCTLIYWDFKILTSSFNNSLIKLQCRP